MWIPRIWERETVEGVTSRGHKINASGWGWSESSSEEARGRARESATRVLNWLISGSGAVPHQYGYDERLPREEIIDEYTDDADQPHAFVSRNAYGALILNTRDLMFIDIDLPPKPPASPLALLGKLFGKKDTASQEPADTILAQIRETANENRDLGFRVYRTANGYRLMIANQQVLPDSPQAQLLLQQFHADPLYIRMCKNQQCFRARLTPKAWRSKIRMPPAKYPFADPVMEKSYRAWEKEYNDGTKKFSTCDLVEIIGPETVHPQVAGLVQLHDQLTKVSAQAPLA